MAVTLTIQRLAYSMRLVADITEVVEEPIAGVLSDLLGAASALAIQYAPNAPDAVHNEAVTRLVGFLYDVPPGANRPSINPMRNSGAMALLSSFRVQRAIALAADYSESGAPHGFRLVADTEVIITTAGVWTATGVQKPSTSWFAYQVANMAEITPVLLIAPGSLDQSAVAGVMVDVSSGMVLGCDTSGEILLAYSRPDNLTLRVWSVNL